MLSLYFLRFLAAFAMYLNHIGFKINGTHGGPQLVIFFFVLSGYVNSYSFSKNNFILTPKNYIQYILKKIYILYPTYVITMLIEFVLNNYAFDLKIFLQHLFMLQCLIPSGESIFHWNGSSWFIADCFLFYFILPFINYIIKRYFCIKKILAVFLLGIPIFLILISLVPGELENYSIEWWFFYISPYCKIIIFMFGYLLAEIFNYIKNNQIYTNITSSVVKKCIWTGIEVFSFVFVFLNYYNNRDWIGTAYLYNTRYLMSTLTLIFIYSFNAGYISKLFSCKLFVFLGMQSSIIYLFHEIFIKVNVIYFNRLYAGSDFIYLTKYFCVLVTFCILYNKFFATPFSRLLSKNKIVK